LKVHAEVLIREILELKTSFWWRPVPPFLGKGVFFTTGIKRTESCAHCNEDVTGKAFPPLCAACFSDEE